MDLTDRGGGDGLVAPVEEDLLGRRAELGLDDLCRQGGRHGCDVGLQRGQRISRLVGEALDDERQDLTGLHHRPLHVTQLSRHVLGAADGVGPVELGTTVRIGTQAADAVDAVADGPPRREPPDAKGTLQMDTTRLVVEEATSDDEATRTDGECGRDRRGPAGHRASRRSHRR